ncbi:hypothetical protein NBH00_02030 [Paraconexibacter antarcticus]|uniref:DUF2269 family protein n=1 Tax=Paraconexibacter antarcticus TaxID=2949664 RepID=A0ABY5DVW7_9ACTN|nr:hypothetical protein [Paraconexibacter antarcticus]UTI64997.1 hypothetical protein NBH00_02030 [Paraconexibacter antarcticus]
MYLAIYFYDVVVAVHVAAIVVAFGVTFAYPLIDAQVRRLSPRSLPAWHEIVATVNAKLTTPAMAVALFAGIYAAQDRHLMGKSWVAVPFAIIFILFGLVGAFFTPQSRKLATLAAADVAAAPGDGPVTFGAAYEAAYKRVAVVGTVAGLMVLLAIFFMVTKPGGY